MMAGRGAEAVGKPRDERGALVELRGVSKHFPGVQALDDVSLEIHSGEVHMLLGQNGAGKSTLMKVLYGAYQPNRGEILIEGRPVRIASPAVGRRLGIAVIFQEFSLVPYLDLAHNIFLGREPRGPVPGTIDHATMHAVSRRLLESLGMDLDTRAPAHTLGMAQQQMVEIAKALSQNARILVLDEPTAALSERETERLFATVRRLRAEGVAMVYISHRLPEVFLLGDRITVLRDGKRVAAMLPGETDADRLVQLMVGRSVDTAYARERVAQPGAPVLEVERLAAANGVSGISLQVRAGEIVGLAGLVGAGRTEVARAIFGADRITAGEVRILGAPVRGAPHQIVPKGVALIPENRKAEGLALIRSVRDNLLVAALKRTFGGVLFRPRKAYAVAANLIDALRIVTPSVNRLARFLSGGNQQKIVVGKWLNAGSRLYLFDEPTRGIDVGAKAEIFALIDRLVKQGAGVLMISSELAEIVKVCDRAYVMRDKGIVGELSRSELSEESILRLAMHHE
jgi:ribose transport system ATP-binding protein